MLHLFTLIFCIVITAQNVEAQVIGNVFSDITYFGSGCDANTFSTTQTTMDSTSTLNINTHNFAANTGSNGRYETLKQCQIFIPIQSPVGHRPKTAAIAQTGSHNLPQGSIAQVKTNYFLGSAAAKSHIRSMAAKGQGDWSEADWLEIPVNTVECGHSFWFLVVPSILLRSKNDSEAKFSLGREDGTAIQIHLGWETCA